MDKQEESSCKSLGSLGDRTMEQSMAECLECTLCLSFLCEPVSISCGHTFCRVCLVKSLRRHKKKCPACRAVCHIEAETANENVLIKEICMRVKPDTYRARLEENRAEKQQWSSVLPIFFYNEPLFPGSRLSLHLFEPRYKLMMQRIVNAGRKFAYVGRMNSNQVSVGDVALTALIEEAEFLPDGRCLLEANLIKRETIVETFVEDGTQGLHFCRTEALSDIPLREDELEDAAEMKAFAVSLIDTMEGTMKKGLEHRFGPMPRNDYETLSLWFLGVAPIDPSRKLALLKTRDTMERFGEILEFWQARADDIDRADGVDRRHLRGLPPLPPEDEETESDSESDEIHDHEP